MICRPPEIRLVTVSQMHVAIPGKQNNFQNFQRHLRCLAGFDPKDISNSVRNIEGVLLFKRRETKVQTHAYKHEELAPDEEVEDGLPDRWSGGKIWLKYMDETTRAPIKIYTKYAKGDKISKK